LWGEVVLATDVAQPSQREMEELIYEHMRAEQARDLDRVMATLCPDPVFEIHPLGIRIEGWDAVAEKYRRTMSGIWADVLEDTVVGIWRSNDSVVMQDVARCTLSNGKEGTLHALTIFDFQGDRLKGERVYLGALALEMMKRALGSDFNSVQGVTQSLTT
jgi:ketosteroid isomerase-like protein